MITSKLTSKGQTTVPIEIRRQLNLSPKQKLIWELQPDGTITVRPQPSILDLFGVMRTDVPFPGTKEEKEAGQQAIADEAIKECR